MKLSKKVVVKKIGNIISEIILQQKITIEKVLLDSQIEYIQLCIIELDKINTSIYQIYKISN